MSFHVTVAYSTVRLSFNCWRAKRGGWKTSYCRACPYVVYLCRCYVRVCVPYVQRRSARKILRTPYKKMEMVALEDR